MFKGRGERIKVHFTIELLHVDHFKEQGKYYLQWRRGDKADNHGKIEPKEVDTSKSHLIFNTSFDIKCTISKTKNSYEKKMISFGLKEVWRYYLLEDRFLTGHV